MGQPTIAPKKQRPDWTHGCTGAKRYCASGSQKKRYRELISCAHGGWYQDDVIFEPLAEHFVIAKYRKRALDQIIRYAGYLEQIHAPAEYLEQVKVLQKSVSDLTIKTKDLKPFRFRL